MLVMACIMAVFSYWLQQKKIPFILSFNTEMMQINYTLA